MTPALEHIYLAVVSVALGFPVAFRLAVLAHRQRWLIPPITAATGVLYTIPSLRVLLPAAPVHRPRDTPRSSPSAPTRSRSSSATSSPASTTCPPEAKDAGSGMGMTEQPAPLAGGAAARRRRRSSRDSGSRPSPRWRWPRSPSSRARAASATEIYARLDFKTNVLLAGGLCILIALAFDLLLLAPAPGRALADGEEPYDPVAFLGSFGGAFQFIFTPQESLSTGGRKVGGLDQVWDLTKTHLEVSLARPGDLAAGRPADRRVLGHYGGARPSRSRSATRGARSPSWR